MFVNSLSFDVPGMDEVIVDRVVYDTHATSGDLAIDLYRSADHERVGPAPVVIFVMGYPNDSRQVGGPLKDLAQYRSWGRLVAASGMVGITYETTESGDTQAVIDHVRSNADELGIDPERVGLFAASANVGTALSIVMQPENAFIDVSVLYYGLMFGPRGAFRETLDDVCSEIGCYGPELTDYPEIRDDLPLFVVKTGRDRADLKATIDEFVAAAETAGAPLTYVDYPAGPHGFDTDDQSARSAEILAETLDFMQAHLA